MNSATCTMCDKVKPANQMHVSERRFLECNSRFKKAYDARRYATDEDFRLRSNGYIPSHCQVLPDNHVFAVIIRPLQQIKFMGWDVSSALDIMPSWFRSRCGPIDKIPGWLE